MADGGNMSLSEVASPILSYLGICIGLALADSKAVFMERFIMLMVCNIVFISYIFMTVYV